MGVCCLGLVNFSMGLRLTLHVKLLIRPEMRKELTNFQSKLNSTETIDTIGYNMKF